MDLDEFWTLRFDASNAVSMTLKRSATIPKTCQAVMGDGIICGIAGVNEEGDAITPYIITSIHVPMMTYVSSMT